MSRTLASILFASVFALALGACGNKGPLVLPDKTPEQQDKDKKKDQQPPASPAEAKTPADAAAGQH